MYRIVESLYHTSETNIHWMSTVPDVVLKGVAVGAEPIRRLKGNSPWKVQVEFPKDRGYKPRLQGQQRKVKSDELGNMQWGPRTGLINKPVQ